jgi:hypothetical protein
MRVPSKEASDNWIKQLMIIKEEINIGDKIHLYRLIRNKNISNYWGQFLINHKIVYKENGFLKWNERVPITIKLVEVFRKWIKNKNRNIKSILLPPPPEFDQQKIKQQQEIILTKQTQKYGLIRSFIYYVIVPLFKKLW